MNTLSIPIVAMASISLYVGLYHLLIYFRRRRNREDLTFSSLCFAYVFYAAFCVGLYNADSVMEGAQWQRAQFITLAVFVTAFLWFVSDYTRQKPNTPIYLLSIFYLFAIIVQLVDRSNLTFPLSQPSVKYVMMPYMQPITYYEVALGPFTTIQSLMGVVASTYILVMGIRYFRRGYKREGRPLILAIGLMSAAGLHDTLVSNSIYHFIYLIEYAYLAVIVVMAYSLSNTVVEAAMAKEKLKKSEERFRSLVETTSDWVWEVDSNGVYTYTSPKVRELLGYEPEEIVGLTPFDLMPADEAKRVRVIFQNIMLNGQILEGMENIVRRKDGQILVLETNGVPFFNENGRLLGYRGIDRDITERKRAEEAIRAERQRFQTILETIRVPTLISRLSDGEVLYANQAIVQVSQVHLDKLIGFKTPSFYANPDDRKTVLEALQAHGHIDDFEVQFRRTDGSLYWALLSSRIFNYEGEPCVLSTYIDITDRKRAEKEIENERQRLQTILETIRVPVTITRISDNKVIYANEALAQNSQVDLNKLIGFKSPDFFANPEQRETVVEALIRDRYINDFEVQFRRTDGTLFWVLLSSRVFNYEGELCVLSTNIDITERKRVEEALRDSEQKFRLFVEQSSDGLVFTDEHGIVIEWNQAQEQLTGLSRQECIGRPLWDVQLDVSSMTKQIPGQRQELERRILQTLETGQADFLDRLTEIELFRRDGTKVIVQQMTFGIKTNQGYRLGSIIRDITKLKQVEEELKASESRFRRLVEASPIPMWTSTNGIITYINSAALQALGATHPDQLLGRVAMDFIHPDYHSLVGERVSEMVEAEESVPPLEEKYVRLDGSLIDVEVIATPFSTSGEIVIQVFFQDITKRKHAEQALRESEERLRQIASSLRETIWLRDVQTRQVLYVNPAFEELTGWTCESFYEKPDIVRNAIHPDDKEWVIKALAQRFKGVTYDKEHRITHRDGSVRWVSSRSFPVRNEAGEVYRWASIMEDITERKQAETERERLIAELENKNAELERFTYTVSHDLKAPLITIRGFLGFIEQDIQSGNMHRWKGDIQRISIATDQMQRLLNELLELSRIGRITNPPENIAFGDLIQEVIKLLEARLLERNIEVIIQDDLPVVYGDSQRLLEVVQNLLDNAVKFMGEQASPVIEIGTQGEENDMPIFYVRDNGIGIAPEHHDRIFGLFNKLDPRAEGTGVGLAIVKRIVEVHGGRIWVESEQGKGTTFYFTFGKSPGVATVTSSKA